MALVLAALSLFSAVSSTTRPNILLILIDDLGWNDVSFHNGSDFETPNIDRMAHQSLILNQYYIQHICTPTRSALLSGLYPIHTGMQHGVLGPTSPYGLPLNLGTLPQDLKKAGYQTHAIGKWHCGFFTEDYVPTSRGFDSYFGHYLGAEDYYYHNRSYYDDDGFDLRNDTKAIRKDGEYSTYLFANETLRILDNFKSQQNENKNPFFIYLPFQAIHGPLEAPQNVIDSLSNITNMDRRLTAAMMTVLDDSLGEIFDYLQSDKDIWDNLLLIWSTDNGGPVQQQHNNWPLRGSKGTLWEGGVRGDGFVGGGYLNSERRGKVSEHLMHITDWYPTLAAAAGIKPTNESILDGFNMLDVIQNGEQSPRTEILHNIDPLGCNTTMFEICGGIRMNLNDSHFKLVIGNEVAGQKSGWDKLDDTDGKNTYPTVKCKGKEPNVNKTGCPYNGEACLFKLDEDECEYRDVKNDYENEFNILWKRLLFYNSTMKIPLQELYPADPEGANPKNLGGFWGPWKNASDQNRIEL